MWLGGDLILSAPAGQIGIGITPGVPFHVASALYGDSSYFDLYDNVGTGVFLSVRKSRHDTIGSHTIVQDGDDLGGIKGFGSDGSAFRQAGRIAFAVAGTPGASDMPGRIVFFTTPDGSLAPTERLRIDSTGKLIIGADLDTYAYLQAADSWGFVAGGVEMLRLTESTNDQVFIGPAGSNTVPALSLITDADTGLAWSAADTLAVIVGGIEKGLFKTTGFEPGSGSFVAGGGQIYTDATNGLFVVGQTGTSFDLIVAEGSGGTLFSNAAGTTVINFASTPTVGGTAVSLVGHTH